MATCWLSHAQSLSMCEVTLNGPSEVEKSCGSIQKLLTVALQAPN